MILAWTHDTKIIKSALCRTMKNVLRMRLPFKDKEHEISSQDVQTRRQRQMKHRTLFGCCISVFHVELSLFFFEFVSVRSNEWF